MAVSSLKCVSCHEYLFQQPMQCSCGDRFCGPCFQTFKERNTKTIICPQCQSEIVLEDCFRDRAATMELRKAVIQCTSPGCSWESSSEKYLDHMNSCPHKIISCPHRRFGCRQSFPRCEMNKHQDRCEFKPVQCRWCGEDVANLEGHQRNECQLVVEYCSNGCGELIARTDMEKHMKNMCTHQVTECDFKDNGCSFQGKRHELNSHNTDQLGYHMRLVKQSLKKIEQSLESKITTLTQQNSDLKSELNQVRLEIGVKMQPVIDAVVKAESAIQHLQEGFAEMALMVQTLQATSYSGTFVWKIPEIQRRRHEAKIGKTVSLYSAPFYTSRHGYKVCLRLYMDGDGSGKGTHLSFFLTVMKGEFDALLPWPFKQTATLVLVDQDKLKDIVQSFRPEPTSSSFQRPRNEMNVASGCPMFAPLSVLNNSSYVKDDTMFLKCKIETAGINVE